ncbi:hypothetical protein ABES02_16165 [Neobacillus pocheonensis]|uniref:hypothetical protein n=1 Tax=Neobacillus pocheonensis TaxID=363869 RepID=UPI003D2CA228
MDIQSQVLDRVLRNFGKTDEEIITNGKNVSENDFKKYLKELNLEDFQSRNVFYWELQSEVEKAVYENIALDDSERISEIISESWNQNKDIKVTPSVVLSFLYVLNFKFPNSRKAFAAICDGDFQSYKAFNNKANIFSDLLVRYLTCIYPKNNMIHALFTSEKLIPRLFESAGKNEAMNSFERQGLSQKKGRLGFSQMSKYKRIIGVENLVFADGMRAILLDVLKEEDSMEIFVGLRKKLESPVSKEEKEEFEVDNLLEEETLKVNTPILMGNNEKHDLDHMDEEVPVDPVESLEVDESNIDTADQAVISGLDEVSEEREMTPKNKILSSLEQALESLQQAITQVSLIDVEEKTTELEETDTNRRLKIAEEEINRLQLALSQEREKVAQAEEKAYKNVLQAIGGESSNYLLSDLFEESQGKIPDNPNISTGRLVNLFSSLSLAIGLEEFNGGHELGESFKIQKTELIKNYRIDGPIERQDHEIPVKLLKYGWTMNGMVIVQPLVTEVKEKN